MCIRQRFSPSFRIADTTELSACFEVSMVMLFCETLEPSEAC